MSDTTQYRYDGQKPIQEVRSGKGGSVVIDSALGARGVEAYSKRVGTGAATIGYPLYDAHGNNVATLTKGSGTWSIAGTLRAYDAWGNLAGGSALGDPSGRYCANLGHVQDDESGLVYMRARYYEPGSGRFISEDPARDGLNWFAYCGRDPVNKNDFFGERPEQVAEFFIAFIGGPALVGLGALFDPSVGGPLGPAFAQVVVGAMAFAYANLSNDSNYIKGAVAAIAIFEPLLTKISIGAAQAQNAGVARAAVYYYAGYSALIVSLLIADALEGGGPFRSQ